MSEEKQNMPEGRKVKKDSSSTRDTLYLRREQLLREMQSDDDVRPISVREQVAALEGKGTPKTPSEDDWGSKKGRSGGNQWMLWTIVGLALPVLVLGVLLLINRSNEATTTPGQGMDLDFDRLKGTSKVEPEDWFVENSAKVFEQAVDVLEQVSEPKLTAEKLAPLIRTEEQVARVLELQEAESWAAFDMRQPSELTWEYGSSGGAGFMALLGPRADYRDFRAYFVRDETNLKLDVDATEGYSEQEVVNLPGMMLQKPTLMRVWVAKEPNFDSRADEGQISWYQLLDKDLVEFVWAYAPAGSLLDAALREELNYGRAVGDRKREFRGIIKISSVKGLSDDQFRIDELIATEWVLPSDYLPNE